MSRRNFIINRSYAFKRRRQVGKIFFRVFVSAGVLGAALYAFFFSGVFSIAKIQLTGFEKTSVAEAHAIVNAYLENQWHTRIPQNNFFLLSRDELHRRFRDRFPELAEIAVEKKFPNRLSIGIRERTYAGIWCATEASKCYLLDTQGVLYGDAASSSGTLVMVLRSDKEAGMSSTVINPDIIRYLADIRELLRDQFGLVIREFNVSDLPDVIAYPEGGWKLLLDVSHPPHVALEGLKKALETLKNGESGIEYMDLRIEGRAYYKLIESTPAPTDPDLNAAPVP